MEKVLKLTETKARQLYPTASPELKEILENTFGIEALSMKITDRVKSYQDACRETGETPIDENALRAVGVPDDEIVYKMLKTITRALNQKWRANYSDGNQKKWYPYFDTLSSSGFAFDDTNCYDSGPVAGLASRLCFESDELATYAGNQFLDLYKRLIL